MMKLFHRAVAISLLVIVFMVLYFAVHPYNFISRVIGETSTHTDILQNNLTFGSEKSDIVDTVKLKKEWDDFLNSKSIYITKVDVLMNKVKKKTNQEKKKARTSPSDVKLSMNSVTETVRTTEKLTTFSVSNTAFIEPVSSSEKVAMKNAREESKGKSIYQTEKEFFVEDELVKNENQLNNSKPSKKKLILIYTGLHKFDDWPNLPKSKTKGYFKNILCKAKNCRVTYDKNLFKTSDAVIFHERNMPGPDMLETLNSWRTPQQRWIFFTSETPKNSDTNIVPYNGLFNWTMTYKKDSDIYLPYLQYRKLSKSDARPPANYDYSKLKTMTTAWMVTNCNFYFRMEYVKLLQEYTDVHVGGGCRDKFKIWINCSRWCPIETLKPYKFYLSFENGICTDYISEKYWRYLELGLVPVVLGGGDYSDPRLAIPGSFIDASKFSSAKDLGDYLNYLDKNDSAYNEYFSWKQKYKIWHPVVGDWPFESYFLCKICEMLNADLPKKTYWSLSEFWNAYTDCEMPESNLKRSMFPENFDWENPNKREEESELLKKSIIRKNFDDE